jgi:hypothetical protein
MTTEFVQINEDTFRKYQNSVCEDVQLTKRVGEILNKYACFHDYSAFQSYSKNKKHVSHTNHHHTQPHISHQRKPILSNQSTLQREITALLNKISRDKYEKISKQILHLCNPKTIKEITKNVLEKCQKQPGFLELYVGIIHDIYMKSNIDLKKLITQILSEYIDDFVEKREFENYHLDSIDYNEFCCNMDNKKQIIGKHKTILAIIHKILRNNTIDEYFNIMFNEIIVMNKENERNDVERLELLLDIMTDFVKTDKRYQTHIGKYYSTHVKILESYSMKAKFKVMNITEIHYF